MTNDELKELAEAVLQRVGRRPSIAVAGYLVSEAGQNEMPIGMAVAGGTDRATLELIMATISVLLNLLADMRRTVAESERPAFDEYVRTVLGSLRVGESQFWARGNER